MSGILSSILTNMQALENISSQSGIDVSDISKSIKKIAPVLLEKTKNNFKSNQNSDNLINLINNSNSNNNQNDINFGNSILGELLGSKDKSRELASNVSSQIGIDDSVIKKLLPMIAPLVLGSLEKNTSSLNTSNGNSLSSMLADFIDQNNDGNLADDLVSIASNIFK